MLEWPEALSFQIQITINQIGIQQHVIWRKWWFIVRIQQNRTTLSSWTTQLMFLGCIMHYALFKFLLSQLMGIQILMSVGLSAAWNDISQTESEDIQGKLLSSILLVLF